METLAVISLIVACVAAIGGGLRISHRLNSIASGPVTVKRRDGSKAVTLPPHYDERAVRALHELLA